jgi:hypothetical protein
MNQEGHHMSGAVEFDVRSSTQNKSAVLLIHGYSGDAHTTFGMTPTFLAGDVNLGVA